MNWKWREKKNNRQNVKFTENYLNINAFVRLARLIVVWCRISREKNKHRKARKKNDEYFFSFDPFNGLGSKKMMVSGLIIFNKKQNTKNYLGQVMKSFTSKSKIIFHTKTYTIFISLKIYVPILWPEKIFVPILSHQKRNQLNIHE